MQLLKEINPDRVKSNEVEQITNRRVTNKGYKEQSGEHFDIMNIIHVYSGKAKFPYSLVTTETDLRQHLRERRNRSIEGWGTVFVLWGIFWQYLWEMATYLLNKIKHAQRSSCEPY